MWSYILSNNIYSYSFKFYIVKYKNKSTSNKTFNISSDITLSCEIDTNLVKKMTIPLWEILNKKEGLYCYFYLDLDKIIRCFESVDFLLKIQLN